MPTRWRLALLLIGVVWASSCVEITFESRHFLCVVNGDTLRLRDTTGVRCAVIDTVRTP